MTLHFPFWESSTADRMIGRTMTVHHLQRIGNKKLYMPMPDGMSDGKMDQLPYELLHCIFDYVDQLPDLIRASLVCQHWRSSIMKNEHFLNQWFSRSLKRSRQSSLGDPQPANNGNHQQRKLARSIDPSLFPAALESGECCLLPTIDPFHLNDCSDFYAHRFPPSLFDGFHTFSFWLFLPRECELAVEIGYSNVFGLNTCLRKDRKSNGNKKEEILSGDQWLHIVLANVESCISYRIWINGQDSKGFDLPELWHRYSSKHRAAYTISLSCKRINYSVHSPIESRIADFVAFKRCLSLIEIRAIHEQQTTIDRVQIGTHLKNKNISPTEINRPPRFDSFVHQALVFFCVTLPSDLIRFCFK